jgi:hypothetical protein
MLQAIAKRLHHPIRSLKEPFGRAGLIAAVAALALGLAATPAFAAPPTFEGTFGTGTGELPSPIMAAVDASSSANAGDVYVASGGPSVIRYNSSNTKVGEITSANAEECAGALGLLSTWGVAVNSTNGDVYVSDLGNLTVTAFDPEGHCLWQVPGGFPTGVAVDPSGSTVYVADRNVTGILKLNATSGAEEGTIGEPNLPESLGIAVDPSGNIFAVDGTRVLEFNSSGTCLNSCTPITETGPLAVTVNPATGHVFIVEKAGTEEVQISEYEPEGSGWKLVESFGTGDFGGSQRSFGLAVGNGNLYATDLEVGEVSFFSLGGGPPPKPTLTVKKQGNGAGTLTSEPSGINCGSECSAQFEENEKVVLTEEATAGSAFAGWEGCEAEPEPSKCEVTMTASKEVKATFSKEPLPKFKLNVVKSAEDEVTGPEGLACGPSGSTCSVEIEETTEVTLTANAAPGFVFEEWTEGPCAGSKSSTCKFAMPSSEVTVAAKDAETHAFPLTVFVTGHGSVSANSGTISGCTEAGGAACEGEFEGEVELEAATAEPGWAFAGWLGCKHVTANTCTVNVTAASEVTAVFLKEGTEGPPGPKGEEGAPGPTGGEGPPGAKGTSGEKGAQGAAGGAGAAGAAGAQGEKGANGANGLTGPLGAQGPAGPAGAQGPAGPAGKVELVTCTKKGKKKKCTSKLVSGTVKFTATGASAHAMLSRHGKVYAAGTARVGHGRLSLRLQPLRKLRAGHYTLTLILGSGRHETVRTESFTLS